MCILLVEDEWIILAEMAQALEDEGYEVATSNDGQEALATATTYGARILGIVTDLHVPGLVDGRVLIETMRGTYPGIPMVMATANPHALLPSWLSKHGVTLLPKPYLSEELVALVNELVGAPGR